MQIRSLAEELLFVTTFLQGKTAKGSLAGTGFVFRVDLQGGTQAPFLITNKHVLSGVTELKIRFVRADPTGNHPQLGFAREATMADFHGAAWKGHPDPAVDVAAYPLAEAIEGLTKIGQPPFYKSLESSMCLNETNIGTLDALEEVTFLGYPNGIYDTKNFVPVARRGSTATPIALDYRGEPAFLIDASVFPGSSGSPVFIINQGTYRPRGLQGIAFGDRFILLGVLAAVHVRQVEGSATPSLPAALTIVTEETLDLGIVYKASAIEECVQLWLDETGLKRV